MKRSVARVYCAGALAPREVEVEEHGDGSISVAGSPAPAGTKPRLAVVLHAADVGWDWTGIRLEGEPDPDANLSDPSSAEMQAFDAIAVACGCPEWDYPAQLVRDVRAVVAERDALLRAIDDPVGCARAVPEADLRAYLLAHGWSLRAYTPHVGGVGRTDVFAGPSGPELELTAGQTLGLTTFGRVAEAEGRSVTRVLAGFLAAPCRTPLAPPAAAPRRRVGVVSLYADPSAADGIAAEVRVAPWTSPCVCCPRAGEYNGFGSDGPREFRCPKGCPCHD